MATRPNTTEAAEHDANGYRRRFSTSSTMKLIATDRTSPESARWCRLRHDPALVTATCFAELGRDGASNCDAMKPTTSRSAITTADITRIGSSRSLFPLLAAAPPGRWAPLSARRDTRLTTLAHVFQLLAAAPRASGRAGAEAIYTCVRARCRSRLRRVSHECGHRAVRRLRGTELVGAHQIGHDAPATHSMRVRLRIPTRVSLA